MRKKLLVSFVSSRPSSIDSISDVKTVAHRLLAVKSGILFANPIPKEYDIPIAEFQKVIQAAIEEAASKGFHGASNTPFIMSKIKEATADRSLPANKAVLDSNVGMAARVAVELSKLK